MAKQICEEVLSHSREKSYEIITLYQRWSPRGRPWPLGHILKSLALALNLASKVKSLALASKPQVLENCLSSARRQHYFLNRYNDVLLLLLMGSGASGSASVR